MQTIGNFYAPHTRAEASPPSPTSTMIGCDSQLFADYYGKNETVQLVYERTYNYQSSSSGLHCVVLESDVGAAQTLFNMRLNPDVGSWDQHTSPWATSEFGSPPSPFHKRQRVSRYETRHINTRVPSYNAAQKSAVSLNIGDEVCVVGCREGQAKCYNGQWGRITSHRTKSPWYTVHFRDGKTVPVRSHCLKSKEVDFVPSSSESGSTSDSSESLQ